MLHVYKSSAYYLYPDLCEDLIRIARYLMGVFDLEHQDLSLRFTMSESDGDCYTFENQCISINMDRIYDNSTLASKNIYECLCHEFCHHIQWCEKRLKYVGYHCQYNGKLYDPFAWCGADYVRLPWEVEANDFMRIITPNVVEALNLPQRTALTGV